MGHKDQDLSLEDLSELEIGDSPDESSAQSGFDELSLDDPGLDLSVDDGLGEDAAALSGDDVGLSLSDDEDLSQSLNDLSLDEELKTTPEVADKPSSDDAMTSFKLLERETYSEALNDTPAPGATDSNEFSESAKQKLKEIDALMESTASHLLARPNVDFDEDSESDRNLDVPLVSPDLNLDSIRFEGEPGQTGELTRGRKKSASSDASGITSLKEISGAYSHEMERTQATIANLRADREELLRKIEKLEEEKLLHNRQSLSLRAELDEKKIELTIIRKKLNEEISELKDRMRIHDEKRLILEEKNRVLQQELDKATQKNKIDIKKVQLRERELEQRLELLKSDAETQIKHRDLKILELKRKIDSMEFDMESISQQEKRSVESRFELEDKLDKAIKTLRSAITTLETESEKNNVLEALKKNIDM